MKPAKKETAVAKPGTDTPKVQIGDATRPWSPKVKIGDATKPW